MRDARFVVMALFAMLAVSGSVGSGIVPGQEARDEGSYAPMPWHLVDMWWDLHAPMPFESLAVDVAISDDVPASVNLYIAPIGLGHLGDTPFYGGIQTQADGYTRDDQRLRRIGPGFLFSMWGERRLDAIRPSAGGLLQSSGHEGDFISVRRPHAWSKGTYTYRLVRMDREEIDGAPFTWVGAFVYSHERHENIFIGALRVPGENLVLKPSIANFVEIYGPLRPVSEIPELTVTFGPPVINGRPAPLRRATAVYPNGVPDVADAVAKDGSIVITVGRPVANREARQVVLIDGEQKGTP
ncbi:DUF3472 domain-containing protein [Tautonia rosea]|uniref:DUF3472 domain-containing protein n=1 Tax=Tautonia rosea TaxID=2728037 RepID=UPI0014746622|nr:hypothetical protein [Tautonia rosea]